ncbi:MAG: hypothetical protein R3Y33_07290 [Clostridia bacterium]
MYCINQKNALKYSKIIYFKGCELMDFFRYILVLLLSIGILILGKRTLYKRKRLSEMFVCSNNNIVQSVSKSGRKRIAVLKDNLLDVKINTMARIFLKELKEVLEKLEIGKIYTMTTHIKRELEKMEKQKKIEIICCQKAKYRYLHESISFLGVKDYLKIRYNKDKEKRKKLKKQFYKFTIKRIK